MQENESKDQTDVNLDGSRGIDDDVQKDPATQQVSSAEERELSVIESESTDQQVPDDSILEQQVDANQYVASQKKSHKGLVVGVVLLVVALAVGAAYIVLPK